jgi:O-antigen/teichoic acid export membrane protein
MPSVFKEIQSIISVQFLRNVAQLAILPILSRSILPETFGEFAILLSIFSVCIKTRDFGIHHYIITNRISQTNKIKTLASTVLINSIICGILFYLVNSYLLPSNIDNLWVLTYSVIIIATFQFNLCDAYFRSTGDLKELFKIDKKHLLFFLVINISFIVLKLNLTTLLLLNPLIIFLAQFYHYYSLILKTIPTPSEIIYSISKKKIQLYFRDVISPIETMVLNLIINNFGTSVLGSYNRASTISASPIVLIGQNVYSGLLAKDIIIKKIILIVLLFISPVVFISAKLISPILIPLILGGGWEYAIILFPYTVTYYYVHWASELTTLKYWRKGESKLLNFRLWDVFIVIMLYFLILIINMDITSILIILILLKGIKGVSYAQ